MDFETRQKLAIEEINATLAKYAVALKPFLDASADGITPRVRLIDVAVKEEVNETKEDAKETKKTKKGKK